MRKHLAVAGAAALSLALAAPAAAEPLRSGKFRVELKGVQTTTWEAHHATQFECDVNIDGSGAEKVRFRSRPAVVSVRRLGRSSALIMRGRDVATLDLDASITRQGSIETRGGAVCSDGDGGGDAPAAPDCGAKRSRLSVELRYLPGRRQLIGIQPDLAVPLGPFATCPVGGTAWPLLLDRSGATGRPVGARLPVDDLFRHGKNIVIARGREVQEDADDRSTTAIRWELSFTRMGKPRPARGAAARRVSYTGRTSAGDLITFVVSGGRVSAVRSLTPTSCVPTEGTPRAGTDIYAPPGRFPLGRTTKVQTPQPVETAMHYNEVSKWFHFTARRGRRGAISGTLHQNFAFESLGSSWDGFSLIGWVCQGDAQFTARPRR